MTGPLHAPPPSLSFSVCTALYDNCFYYFFRSVDNSRGYVRLQGGSKPRDGKNYVYFDQLLVKISVGKSRFHLTNLFNGDPLLGDVTNQFINENSDLFVSEMIPGFEKSLSKTFLDICNVILKDVTFDEMFPDV